MAKVLLIHSSVLDAHSISLELSKDGHVTRHLKHMVDLAGVLKNMNPDVVVIDFEMPGFPGLKLCQFIRTRWGSQVPIVVHSSQPEDVVLEAVKKVAAAGWIRKGDDLENLRRVVAATLIG